MKIQHLNIYVFGDNMYVLINRKLYKLEECDDEMIAESYNNGDALPIVQSS